MSLFSLEWFKSQRDRQMESLKLEEQVLKNAILKKELHNTDSSAPIKPYKSLKLVNDVITIVLNDGSVICKSNINIDKFKEVMGCATESEIMQCIEGKEEKQDKKEINEAQKMRNVASAIPILNNIPDFEVKGNSVYLKGINRTLPAMLVEKFGSIASKYKRNDDLFKDEEYTSLKRFFMWCCLNPRAEVADDLYNFLERNSFRITKQGFFTALRNVVSLQPEGNELVDFISNSYHKIKAVWKKKPSDYIVYRSDDFEGYKFTKESSVSTKEFQDRNHVLLGNLQDLYDELPNMKENRFTDAWTKSFDIRIGKPVTIPPEKCSWSRADCAEAGLHFTSDEIHYVGCGDTSVLVLINPMKVVGIGTAKGRCYEYLPIMSVPRDEATNILHDLEFDTLELDDNYAIEELKGIEDRIKEGFTAEVKKHEFNLPNISKSEISTIIDSLNLMKEEIENRIVDI